jgi:hypothetical protein
MTNYNTIRLIRKVKKQILLFACVFFHISCDNTEADKIFGDANFTKSISLIELYQVRHSVYPDSLNQIEYKSGYELMAFSSVRYKKLSNGYELDLIRGHMGFPKDLSYPKEFWKGLGCVKSNLKK